MSRSVAFDAFRVAERCCALTRAADLDAPAVKRLLARGEALPETMSTATSDGRLDYVGGRLADGHRVPGDRLGKYWLGGVHPEKRARVAARRLASVESGDPYEILFPGQTGKVCPAMRSAATLLADPSALFDARFGRA